MSPLSCYCEYFHLGCIMHSALRTLNTIGIRKWILILIALITLYAAWKNLPLMKWTQDVSQFVLAQGKDGILVFIGVYVVATILLIPCALFTFAAGMIYGIWGLPLVLFSTGLGASFSFLISRFLIKEKVVQVMERRPSTKALSQAIAHEGWKFMLLLRISPIIPFNLNNYLLGTMPVRFTTYIWVTIIGSVPGTGVYLYLGTIGKDIGEQKYLQWTVLGLGIIATYALTRMSFLKTRAILLRQKVHPPPSA